MPKTTPKKQAAIAKRDSDALRAHNDALLADLANQINTEHAAVIASFRQVMNDRAFKIGKLLLKAKQHVTHGKWLPWIKSNCQFTSRTATFYMQIASMDGAHRKTVADLPLREMQRAISQGKHLTTDERLAESRNAPLKPEPTPEQKQRAEDKAIKTGLVSAFVEKFNNLNHTPGVQEAIIKKIAPQRALPEVVIEPEPVTPEPAKESPEESPSPALTMVSGPWWERDAAAITNTMLAHVPDAKLWKICGFLYDGLKRRQSDRAA
jgi:hypothetical protein